MEPTKSPGLSYALALAGLFSPVAGLHRFYLNRPFSGLLYFFTWGFLGIGTIVDLIRMPRMIAEENARTALAVGRAAGALGPYAASMRDLTPEQQILRVAHEEDGVVTVAIIAARTMLSLREAQEHLEAMYDDGFVQIDISESGAKLYSFAGLRSKEPLRIEGVDD